MSLCRIVSCVVGRGCLLWPVCFLDITLLAFALLHSVLQGQTCLLLQVSLNFLLLHSRTCESENRSVMSDFLWPHGLYSPWTSLGQNTGVGSLFLLQGIFPTHGSNPGLLHCRQILYSLSHKGNPSILEWVAYPFSSRSSRPRNRIMVSCIAGGFFTNWTIREAHSRIYIADIGERFAMHHGEMATYSSIPAWETPWTEEPGGLQFMGFQRIRHNWETKH